MRREKKKNGARGTSDGQPASQMMERPINLGEGPGFVLGEEKWKS